MLNILINLCVMAFIDAHGNSSAGGGARHDSQWEQTLRQPLDAARLPDLRDAVAYWFGEKT